jgi:fluoride exporter
VLSSVLSIGVGATFGALLRWWLGLLMNSIFPTIPLGTFAANIIGCFLMGMVMAITKAHSFLPEAARLAITTGFLGGLTTFSTFSAETVTLLSQHEYLWSAIIISGHVGGSILATVCGVFVVNFFML